MKYHINVYNKIFLTNLNLVYFNRWWAQNVRENIKKHYIPAYVCFL